MPYTDWKTDIRDEVLTLIETTWSDVSIIVRDDSQGRINWKAAVDAVQNSTLGPERTAPWVLMSFGADVETNFGDANQSYSWPLTIYRIESGVNGSGERRTDTEIEDSLNQKLQELAQAFYADGTSFQVEKLPICDKSANMEANQYLQTFGFPFYAGKLTAHLLGGVSA